MAKGGFRGGYPGGNQMNMMKQAQKMQQDFLKMQQELESTRFEFTSGGGAVKAVVARSEQETALYDQLSVEYARSQRLQALLRKGEMLA